MVMATTRKRTRRGTLIVASHGPLRMSVPHECTSKTKKGGGMGSLLASVAIRIPRWAGERGIMATATHPVVWGAAGFLRGAFRNPNAAFSLYEAVRPDRRWREPPCESCGSHLEEGGHP